MSTAGLQFFVGWWYRKAAVFYLPPGWFGPLTWWLALPFAPAGSVSCGVWQMACRRVIKVGERVVRELASGAVPRPARDVPPADRSAGSAEPTAVPVAAEEKEKPASGKKTS